MRKIAARLLLKNYFLFFLVFSSWQAVAQVEWPPVSQTTKPWTRWWWEGSAVDSINLSWNLEQYKNAGLGGVELSPIYGVKGNEDRFIDFLSPRWMQLFQFTLQESHRLGLGVDLANGTGWPFGGPWVSPEDASKTLYVKTYPLQEGGQLKEPLLFFRPALLRTANRKNPDIKKIVQPIGSNQDLQQLALDQVQFPGNLPLVAISAFNEKNASIDLIEKVDSSGILHWTAPPGKWTLYALFQGLHGKMVERAAPGGEGYAIDHFSAGAVKHYFQRFDSAFRGYDLSYLRAFFNDSYEVDDAKGQANWTPGFFEDFSKIKGYDLKKFLPALWGYDIPERNSRVIYDYRSVMDQLIYQHFTAQWKAWAGKRDKLVRNQSHGSPANILDLYSLVDIPETEGNDVLRFKFASSAAHVSGKPLVSAESATWLQEHFQSSWGDVKKGIDLYFLGGVNHIFYHGTAYSPKEAPWPGWLFYASVHFQPTNPQWEDFSALNNYITRVQSFLQSGKPVNDILLYFPINDRWAEPGKNLLQHFDGMKDNFENTDFATVASWLLEKGYNFDFISDRQIQQLTVDEKKLQTAGNNYQTILIPAIHTIPLNTMEKLVTLAEQGATVLFYKDLPADVPGLSRLEERRKDFNTCKNHLHFHPVDKALPGEVMQEKIMKAEAGKGRIYTSDDIRLLLGQTVVKPETMVDKGLDFVKRVNKDGVMYFITNRNNRRYDNWLTLETNAVEAALFDPMTGVKGLAMLNKQGPGDSIEIYLQLEPYQSLIVQTYQAPLKTDYYPYYKFAGRSTSPQGPWKLEFLQGGPAIPAKRVMKQPRFWTDLEGDTINDFSGRACYSVIFDKPKGKATFYLLDLGSVHATAEVFLNDRKLATLIGPQFTTIIPSSFFQKKHNKLQIVVANLMANRIAYMDRKSLPWKTFYNINMAAKEPANQLNGLFNASRWKPLPSGLSGPVTLTPVKGMGPSVK
ncbi:MAG: glycoside hydrolase family 2 protein [Terrimonas sp.]|nr:glycoside hydrolase family 2 protein [Terrimonas sp.]